MVLDLNPDWKFSLPFVGAGLVLLAPTHVLWKARDEADAAAEAAGEEEEEEELSFSEELRRMRSVINRTTVASILAVV